MEYNDIVNQLFKNIDYKSNDSDNNNIGTITAPWETTNNGDNDSDTTSNSNDTSDSNDTDETDNALDMDIKYDEQLLEKLMKKLKKK